MKELSAALDYVSLVMKRMKVLRKRLERVNSLLIDERSEKYSMNDLNMIEKRHEWIV